MMDGPQEVAADTKEILDGAVHRTGCGDPAAERRLACLAARGATFACAPGKGLAPGPERSRSPSLLLILCPCFYCARSSAVLQRFEGSTTWAGDVPGDGIVDTDYVTLGMCVNLCGKSSNA
jgi:hypothetical protein